MKTFKKGMAILVLAIAVICSTGFVLNDIAGGSQDKGSGSLNGHDYVDLGLPSGTLWATCNVGANAPEEFGDYFAWGETEPKEEYNWSTYKYCNDGQEEQLTKYCPLESYGHKGFKDKLKILQPVDDAAVANWGEGWRTPSKEEWEELKDNTKRMLTTRNGVVGHLLTGPNGNGVFLPLTGHVWDKEVEKVGFIGQYLTSAISMDYPNDAWLSYFFTDGEGYCGWVFSDSFYRCAGNPVRPVCSASK